MSSRLQDGSRPADTNTPNKESRQTTRDDSLPRGLAEHIKICYTRPRTWRDSLAEPEKRGMRLNLVRLGSLKSMARQFVKYYNISKIPMCLMQQLHKSY